MGIGAAAWRTHLAISDRGAVDGGVGHLQRHLLPRPLDLVGHGLGRVAVCGEEALQEAGALAILGASHKGVAEPAAHGAARDRAGVHSEAAAQGHAQQQQQRHGWPLHRDRTLLISPGATTAASELERSPTLEEPYLASIS